MRNLDIVVTEQGQSCGGIVYWSLSGVIRREALALAWAAEGLDAGLLPAVTSPERALRAALEELRDRNHIVRPLPDGSGYALHAAHEVDAKTERLEPTLRAFIENGEIRIEPAGHPDATRVLDAYEIALGSVIDGGTLLVRTCKRLGSVTLHDKGRLYFVPAPQIPELDRVVRAVESCSAHRVQKIPAMHSSDAARAVMAAMTAEAEAAAEKMEQELAREGDDAIGGRAIANREERVRALRSKVGAYEALLGGSLDTVRDRLERVQAALAMAALAAAREEEAA